MLEEANLAVTDENLLIAAACKEKGIAFLKGEAKVNVRKIEKEKPATPAASSAASPTTSKSSSCWVRRINPSRASLCEQMIKSRSFLFAGFFMYAPNYPDTSR